MAKTTGKVLVFFSFVLFMLALKVDSEEEEELVHYSQIVQVEMKDIHAIEYYRMSFMRVKRILMLVMLDREKRQRITFGIL